MSQLWNFQLVIMQFKGFYLSIYNSATSTRFVFILTIFLLYRAQSVVGQAPVPFASDLSASLSVPVYASTATDTAGLRKAYASFIAMPEADLLKMIPPQSGFCYSNSPATTQGAQENNISWDLSLGEKVKCIYTGTLLPNEDYPENGYVDVQTPTGKTQRFRYHQDSNGKKYWFEARRWFEQRVMLENAAFYMAQLFGANPKAYREYGRRSVLIMRGFAEVYPDYIVKHDYPGQEKTFLDEAAYKKASQKIDHYFMELTKWSYWGYHDLSSSLLLAYDQLRGTDLLTEADDRLIGGFLSSMVAFTDPHEQVPVTNMHPYMWIRKVIAGNVLNRPEMLKRVFTGINKILSEQFAYDGLYMEATVSYHDQTVTGLSAVLKWAFPGLSKEELNKKTRSDYPVLFRAMQGNSAYSLPDGRYAAINDTHWTDRQPDPITRSEPRLMPASGHAVLGSGSGDKQVQTHLGYSAWHGHDHYGSLSLLLFAQGKELVSDIGYTHTRARTWTMTTAAHNTVVVDGKSQRQRQRKSARAGLGDLVLHNAETPGFQVVEVRADDVYPDHVTDYRRALIAVRSDQDVNYVVDLFHVAGGKQHDWFLHGSADEDQTLEVTTRSGTKLPFLPRRSMLPVNQPFEELKEQGQYELIWKDYWPYGHFKQVQAAPTSELVKATFRYSSNPNLGLQTWIPLKTNHTIHTVKSWAVRGADEDQGVLDNFLRSGLILRSEGGKSRFMAVHVPFSKVPAVTQVTDISPSDSMVVLRIQHRAGKDYVIYRSGQQERTTTIDGQEVRLVGRVTLIQNTASGRQVSAIFRQKAPLKSFDSGSLTVEGHLPAKAGHTAIIQHHDGHTTAFQIDSVSHKQGQTTLFTREAVPFEENSDGHLKMTTFPFLQFSGPHTVAIYILSTREPVAPGNSSRRRK